MLYSTDSFVYILFFLCLPIAAPIRLTPVRVIAWHSPQLKQEDSCFNYYCIGWYPVIFQCLTQCPQARLYCSHMPYGVVLFLFMLTAFKILYSKCLCLHWYLCYALYDSPDIPIYERSDCSTVDSYIRNQNMYDCSDTFGKQLADNQKNQSRYKMKYVPVRADYKKGAVTWTI